jgi:hypothetical protein
MEQICRKGNTIFPVRRERIRRALHEAGGKNPTPSDQREDFRNNILDYVEILEYSAAISNK